MAAGTFTQKIFVEKNLFTTIAQRGLDHTYVGQVVFHGPVNGVMGTYEIISSGPNVFGSVADAFRWGRMQARDWAPGRWERLHS